MRGVKGISASSKDKPKDVPSKESDVWIRLLGTQSNQNDFIQTDHNLWSLQISYYGTIKDEKGKLDWDTKYSQNYDVKFKTKKHDLVIQDSKGENITEAALEANKLEITLNSNNNREGIDPNHGAISFEELDLNKFKTPVIKNSVCPYKTAIITFELIDGQVLDENAEIKIITPAFKESSFKILANSSILGQK